MRVTNDKRQYGLTIVELMVSLVLGLILLGSAIQVFQGNRQSYRIAEALARVQENGRFALQTIAQDIRMAGQLGCGSRRVLLQDTNVYNFNTAVTSSNPPAFDPTYGTSNPIQVFDATAGWSGPAVPSDGANNLTVCDAVGGGNATCQVSDAMAIMRGSDTYALTLANMANPGAAIPIRTSEYTNFSGDDDLFLITDCLRGDFFRGNAATAGNTTTLTPDAALQAAYNQSSMVMPLTGSIYFIASDGTDGIPSLYRSPLFDNGGFPNAIEIAEGVEAMQVMVGEDTNDDSFADVYNTPAAVADWSSVTSIRVSLLVKSDDDFVTDVPTPINFVDGTAVAGQPGLTVINGGDNVDRRLRMAFTTTIAVRNHTP